MAFRYDCELNQWNHCYEFNFAEDIGSYDDGSDSDNEAAGHIPGRPAVIVEPGSPHNLRTVPADHHPENEGQIVGNRQPEGEEYPDSTPTLNNSAYLESLCTGRYKTVSHLVDTWKDPHEFLFKRYGLSDFSEPSNRELPSIWPMRLGVQAEILTISMIDLHKSVVNNNAWPNFPSGPLRAFGHFRARSPSCTLNVTASGEKYLLSVGGVQWKLLVEDPLTLLQIEREEWDMNPNDLAENLIKKGLPFQVLNTHVQQGVTFHDHPEPVIHSTGGAPTQADYAAYQRGLGNFFLAYPHAYAAALCAGGILWRIAMDALPPPGGQSIIRTFHKRACFSQTIGGVVYWTPQLSQYEEHFIVGVYRWAESK